MNSILQKILIIFLPLATIGVAVWLIVPEYQALGAAKAERAAAEITLSDTRKLVEKIRDLQTQYDSVGSVLEKVSRIIPATPNVPDLLLEFPAMAQQYGVNVKDLAINAVESRMPARSVEGGSNQPYSEFLTKVVVEGTYPAFIDFLQALEKNGRIMDVQSIQLRIPDTKTPQAEIYTFELLVKLYYGLTV